MVASKQHRSFILSRFRYQKKEEFLELKTYHRLMCRSDSCMIQFYENLLLIICQRKKE